MPSITLRLAAAAAGILCAAFAGHASAQTKFPTGPIRVLVPYAPGGATDTSSRILVEHLKKVLNENVVVENKVGASGIIAIEEMMRAKPDGHTVMVGNVSTNGLTPLLLAKRMKLDFAKDVTTVARVVDAPVYMAVTTKDFPPQTFQEFVAYVKARPGKLRFSSAGHGSIQQVDTAVLSGKTGIDMVHIPTKAGAAQIQRDLVNGDTQMSWSNPASTLKFIQAGQVRALAVVGSKRLPFLPDVPTMAELGHPEVGSVQWQTMVVPSATPVEVQQILHKAVAETLKQPTIQEAINRVGFMLPPEMGLEETKAWAQSEFERYRKVIAEHNITSEE